MDQKSGNVLEFEKLFIFLVIFVHHPLAADDLCHRQNRLPRIKLNLLINSLKHEPIFLQTWYLIDLRFELSQRVEIKPLLEIVHDELINLFELILLLLGESLKHLSPIVFDPFLKLLNFRRILISLLEQIILQFLLETFEFNFHLLLPL